MPQTSACPDRATLAQLLDGRTNDEQASHVEQHLLACDRCCETLGEMEAADTLVEAARGTTSRLPADEEVQKAIVRLKSVSMSLLAFDETLASKCESTEDAWDLTKLLDPPEGEGELGRFGGYRVLRVLGAGGMGLVFEAEDPKLRRRVALKVMQRSLASRDEHHQRFLREARAAAAIEHPHIVTVYQVDEHKGLPFMAMQLLKGESLDERLRREATKEKEDALPSPSSTKSDGLGIPARRDAVKGALPLREVVRIGREMAEALAEAHQRNLIHRDIKPGNIWLEGASGWVKLVDFGLAHAAEDVHLTQTGAILGTPAYMSPEQARGEAVDGRTDLYSLGAVLYKMATGDVPFRGANTMAVLMSLATEMPRPPIELNPDVPLALNDLIIRLLAKKPSERFDSAAAVVEAIRALEQESPKSKVQSPTSDGDAGRRRPRWPLVAAAAAAAAFVLATIVVIVRDKDGKEVGRMAVPPGGSAAAEESQVSRSPAGTRRKPPGKVAPALADGSASPSPAGRPEPRSVGAAVAEPPPLAEWLKGRTVLTVAQDGSGQFNTIQAALNALQPRQVVKVLDRGPYREMIRAGALPDDTGLIGAQQAIIELPGWFDGNGTDVKVGHAVGPGNGFRLSGLHFLAPPRGVEMEWGVLFQAKNVSGLVVEDCSFGWTAPRDPEQTLACMDILIEDGQVDDASTVVRNCVFKGVVNITAFRGGQWSGTLLVEHNYFRSGGVAFGKTRLHQALIRHNVFDKFEAGTARSAIWSEGLSEIGGSIEIANNTVLHAGFGVCDAPPRGFVVRNNLTYTGTTLFGEATKALPELAKNWLQDHNSYTRRGSFAKSPTDVTADPGFLSRDAANRNYARIPADGPLATGGAGGDWPAYIGALPPGPAPDGGDWFTRLRERWTNVDLALPTSESATGHVQHTADHDKPFVVVRAEGNERKEFKRFTEAIALLRDGDAIEIHGNGPFSIPHLRLDNKGLSIRAASGYRPVLMAKDKFNYNGPWFEVHGGTITLEGCDFFSGDADVAFLGEGPPWEWRNCRFITGGRLASLAGQGQRLTVRDSLIWAMDRTGTSTIQCQSATQIVLINNVVQSSNHGIGLDSTKGGLVMTLTNNTVVNGNRGSWLLLRQLEGDAQPVEIDAVGNLFDLPWMYADVASPLVGDLVGDFDAATMKQLVEQGKLRWQGRDNLYCGSKAPAVEAGNKRIVEGLAAWRAFWGADEAGSMEAPDVSFAWDRPRLLPTQEAIVWLRDVVERAKQNEAKTLPDLGPDWDLIGPGEAYLRALAARGQPVPAEKLRPEPPDDGPFVLLRGGEPVGAYVTLGQAVAAAQSGDTIEIRTDGPFSGCGIVPGCSLVIRAAPGYLPILEGDLRYLHAGELTLEGIHFRGVEGIPRSGCGITCDAGSCDALHVVNCSFEDNAQGNAMSLYVAAWRDKEHSEIINCWVSGTASILADAGSSFLIRNSALCRLSLNLVNMGEDGDRACHIERSVVWPWDGGFAAFHPSERLSVADTWIEGDLAPESFKPGSLKNDRNLYRTGIFDLAERLRVDSRSGDKGSIVAPPLTFDPRQWQLLPDSPFYQAGPGGKDFGADVTRIGSLTALPSPPAADSAAPSAGAREADNGKRASATNPLDSRPPATTVVALDDERALGKWVVEQGGRVGTGSLCTVPVREIWLTDNSSIGDDSLARFQRCPRLTLLDLNATAVSDQGLPQLSSVASLRRLDLRNTDVSDAGLKNLAGLTRLEWLDLARTAVSDAGLNDLATTFPWLRYLSLEGDSISDAGLPALAALGQLDQLDLSGTEVTDAGLAHLKPLTGLARLSLSDTTVSDAAIATLQTDLVDCWIVGADGAIHAPPDRDDGPDRKAVDLWLQTGATMALTTDGVGEADYVAANRPTGPFRVRGIQAGENAFGDADMALVAQLRQLRFARFPYVQITNRGLNCLKDLPKLEQFSALGCTRSTGGGLAVLATLPRLRHVRVNRDCGAAGLRHVLALANLESLVLEGEIVGGDMLERLAGLKQLQSLDLSDTRVTGTGLAHLAELPHLSSLALHATNLSAADVTLLAELRGLESLTLTRFPVSAEALRPLQKLPRLWHLFLENTSLDDDGFEAIGRLTSLELVSVNDATDAGLAQIANLSRLRMLYVNGPTITDAGLERIARLPELRMLDLGGAPRITDAGLAHLQGLAKLQNLRLAGVSVSESGAAAFKAALPGCNVEFPHGVLWQK